MLIHIGFSMANRRLHHLWFFLLPLTVGACSRREPPLPSPAPPTPSAMTSRVDRLDPGELPEGSEAVLGFRVPRGMKISYRGPEGANATGPFSPDRLANYVRSRVDVFTVELGAARTIFDRARVKGEPTGGLVRIEVVARERGADLIIRSLEPEKVTDPELTPEQRWKKHGLDSKGRVLDPTRLQ